MKGENLQRSFANEHWTEAETKSDSQVESLMNTAEFKDNFKGKLYYYYMTNSYRPGIKKFDWLKAGL